MITMLEVLDFWMRHHNDMFRNILGCYDFAAQNISKGWSSLYSKKKKEANVEWGSSSWQAWIVTAKSFQMLFVSLKTNFMVSLL